MSPRQFGKVDVSAGWPACGGCPHRHMPGAPCPPSGVWLVLTMCGRGCNPRTGAYCRWHGGHKIAEQPGDAHHTLPDAPADAMSRAAGEREEG